MPNQSPLLVDAMDWLAKPFPLPPHDFHIGEDNSANIGQFPNLRPLAFFVIGKAPLPPLPDGTIDTWGTGTYALGSLIADAHLKLMRPWAMNATEWQELANSGLDGNEIEAIADVLLPLSPKARPVRFAFLSRIGEFLDIALHRPDRLPSIIAAIDALTNERLTQRARAILETGIDPGACDLWPDPASFPLPEVQP